MKILVASPKPGAGSGAALNALEPARPTYCHRVGEFFRIQHKHQVILSYGFPFHCLPTTKPHVWYCLEPQVYLMREKGGVKKAVSKAAMPIERWRVNSLDGCIVADKANANRFWELYGIHPIIVPYGIDYGFWSQTPPPIDDTVFTVAHIGEIQRFKNQMKSIEAFAEFHEDVSNSRLWIIGAVRDTSYFESMKSRADELGVKFTYIYEMPRERLRDQYYPYIDCVLHPIKLQGGFLTPLEAAAANRPVIVSQECSCSDIIYNHYLGLVSSESYSFWLKYIYDNGYVPRREWIQGNLTWEKYYDGVMSILERLTK